MEDFHDSFGQENTQYYFFIAKISSTNVNFANTSPENTHQEIDFDIWPHIIAIKRIYPENIKFAIKRNQWASGTIYDIYDNNANLDIHSNYFVFSDNKIYICLSNNNRQPSTINPATLGDDVAFRTTDDGYAWHYLYSITNNDIINFITEDFLPVTPDENLQPVNGTIDIININDGGSSYPFYENTLFPFNDGTYARTNEMNRTEISLAESNIPQRDRTTPRYENSTIFIKGSNEDSFDIKDILSHRTATANNAQHIISFEPFTTTQSLSELFNANTEIIISPKITINGNGTGAAARVVNCDTNGSITEIQTFEHGKDYTTANVDVIPSSTTFSSITDANLIPTISPIGGHGKTPHRELLGYNIIMSINLVSDEERKFPTDDSYNVFGIIKNPNTKNGELAKNLSYEADDLMLYSGDILYRENFRSISRNINQAEDFRLILNFYEEESNE